MAIVPDIQSYSIIGSDLHHPCSKRTRASASDCLSIEDELELLSQESQFSDFSFPGPKRHCSDYSISSSPNQFQNIGSPDSIEEFALEVKEDYIFTESKDITEIFTCGGNSPVTSSSSTDFASASSNQASAGYQQQRQDFDIQTLVPANVLDSMHRPSQTVLSHPLAQQHADKYELVITEQPEEVCVVCYHARSTALQRYSIACERANIEC